jgi:hypothetical protein
MSPPKDPTDDNGSGGSSDGDTQPDDTGATGTLAHPATGKQKAAQNLDEDPPA